MPLNKGSRLQLVAYTIAWYGELQTLFDYTDKMLKARRVALWVVKRLGSGYVIADSWCPAAGHGNTAHMNTPAGG